MKKLLFIPLLFLSVNIFADSKITALPELTAPITLDLLVVVDDVAGTPTTKKMLIGNLLNTSLIDHINILSTGTLTHAEIDSELSDLDTSTTTLQSSIDSLESSTSTLEGYIFDLWTDTSTLEGYIFDLWTDTSTLEGMIVTDHTQLTSTGTNTHAQIDSWLSDLATSTTTLSASTVTLAGLITDLETSTSTLEGYIFTLWNSTSTLEGRIETNETDITNLEASTSTLEGYIFDLWVSTSNLEGRVDALEISTSTLEGYIFDLWTSTSALESRIDTAEIDITNLETSTSTLEGYIFDLWVSTSNLETAVDLNTIHRTSDGSDHSFIDQDVTQTGTPSFLEITVSTINPTAGIERIIISSDTYIIGYASATAVYSDGIVKGTGFVTGAATLTIDETASLTDYLQDMIDDTAPELGGELDAGANTIGFTAQTDTGDGTTAIDWTLGNKFHFTWGAQADTFTFGTDPSNPCNLIMLMTQDGGGGRDATWPASVKWLGDEPTWTDGGAGKVIIVAFYFDGTDYWGQGTPWEE